MQELANLLACFPDQSWIVQCRAENDQRLQAAIEGGLTQAQAAVIIHGGVIKLVMKEQPDFDLEMQVAIATAILVEVLK